MAPSEFIQTMGKDMASLEGKQSSQKKESSFSFPKTEKTSPEKEKKAPPPVNLPTKGLSSPPIAPRPTDSPIPSKPSAPFGPPKKEEPKPYEPLASLKEEKSLSSEPAIPEPTSDKPKEITMDDLELEKKEAEPKVEKQIPQEPKKEKNPLKSLLLVLGAFIVLVGIGGFFYWWNYMREPVPIATHAVCQEFQCVEVEGEGSSECANSNDCLPDEPDAPASLIPTDQALVIELSSDKTNLVLDKMIEASLPSQPTGIIQQVLIKTVSPVSYEVDYVSLSEIVSYLNLSIPSSILNTLGTNYTIFFYSQEEDNRAGLVVDVIDPETLGNEMLLWENMMIDQRNPIFLGRTAALPEEPMFKVSERQDILPHRYANLPEPSISIDYAIYKNKLIITASKESMNAALDALMNIPEDETADISD